MDASAFNHVGEVLGKSFNRLMWWAIIGMGCTALGGLTALGFAIWWLVHHVTIS